jgi:hypothetical protein
MGRRSGRYGNSPNRSTGLNGEMNTYVDLANLDAEIESVERTLTRCREGGFMGLTAAVEREIAEHMLPGIAALAALTEGEERAALAARHRRLKKALRADLTQGKTSAKRQPSRRNRARR